jgi:hypothetical protein
MLRKYLLYRCSMIVNCYFYQCYDRGENGSCGDADKWTNSLGVREGFWEEAMPALSPEGEEQGL